MSEIIEVNYREVQEQNERLVTIAAEIKLLSQSLFQGILEIGRRFEEAKSLCKHGEWGSWVTEVTGYKQSMAENYIKVYKEYGGNQINIGGDFAKSQSIANLGITKLLELSSLPAEQRETFAEQNDVENITVRELKKLLEDEKSERNKEKKRHEKELSEQKKKQLESITQYEKSIKEKEAAVSEMTEQLKRMEQDTTAVADGDEVAKLIAEAQEQTKKELQNKIEKANEKLEAEKKQKAKKEEQVKELEQKLSEADKGIKKAEKERQELHKEIARLKARAEKGGNEAIIKVNFCFMAAQGAVQNLLDSLGDIPVDAERENLHTMVTNAIAEMLK